MWTLLKSFIKERPAIYCVHPVRAMIDGHRAVFRDYLLRFLHPFLKFCSFLPSIGQNLPTGTVPYFTPKPQH